MTCTNQIQPAKLEQTAELQREIAKNGDIEKCKYCDQRLET